MRRIENIAGMNWNFKRIFVLFIFCMLGLSLEAQFSQDTLVVDTAVAVEIKKEKKGSIFKGRPGTALLLSLVLPGSGQIYNKSYLRLPFVYAAVGGMGYVLVTNTQKYNCRKMAFIARVDGTPLDLPKYCTEAEQLEQITDLGRLKTLRDTANKYRQRSIMLFGAVWLANGIDAFVDAHLKDFDIDDDLSINLGLRYFDDPMAPARLGLYVNF